MNNDDIIQHSIEYVNKQTNQLELSGTSPQATKGELLKWLQSIDNSIDDYRLNTVIDLMRVKGIVTGYDGTFLFFAEPNGGFQK